MNKVLVIKGADFSTVSVDRVKRPIEIEALINPTTSKGTTNGAYINTGVYGNTNTKIEIKFMFDIEDSSTINGIFGRIGEQKSISITARETSPGSTLRFGTSSLAEIRITKDVPHIISFDKNGLVIDNNERAFPKLTTDFEMSEPLMMFCNGSNAGNYHPKEIYYCKIWDGNTLIRNFIPVKDINSNTYGMLDTINNVFYSSLNEEVQFSGR